MPQNLIIVNYSVGHTGSIHDSWAFQSIHTYKEHNSIFDPKKWMWADSTYLSESWSVLPFKKPAWHELSPDQKTLTIIFWKYVYLLLSNIIPIDTYIY